MEALQECRCVGDLVVGGCGGQEVERRDVVDELKLRPVDRFQRTLYGP
jgi:hypothetical protein